MRATHQDPKTAQSGPPKRQTRRQPENIENSAKRMRRSASPWSKRVAMVENCHDHSRSVFTQPRPVADVPIERSSRRMAPDCRKYLLCDANPCERPACSDDQHKALGFSVPPSESTQPHCPILARRQTKREGGRSKSGARGRHSTKNCRIMPMSSCSRIWQWNMKRPLKSPKGLRMRTRSPAETRTVSLRPLSTKPSRTEA